MQNIRNLFSNKSSRTGQILPLFLKKSPSELVPVMNLLFSHMTKVFFQITRVKHVTWPYPRSTPIILKHVDTDKLIHYRQHRFRQESFSTNLFVTDNCTKSLGFSSESQLIVVDISKAFYRMWHANLLQKLPCYSNIPILCTWISSYLFNKRNQLILAYSKN